ncbi:MAG: hypothetical protein Q8R57_00380, partial [Bacteroidota bacterium]|nr:hypothetical protein [Bacteroidota bacterium]
GTVSVTAAMVNNGSTDACGIASLSLSNTSFTCVNIGANAVTLTVTDVNGNSRIGSATITVLDTITPVVNTQNVTVYLNAAGTASATAAMVNNGSTDACGIASMSLSTTSFTCANVGANAVTLTVTDVNGNVRTGGATITVLDTIKPTVNVTTGIVLYLNASANIPITTAMINNGSSDNCGIASMSVSPSTINCSHIGITPVTLTVTDVNGNIQTRTTDVVVFDPIAPVARPKAGVTVYLNANGSVVINPSILDSASTDNCTITSRVISQSTFNCSNLGNNTISYTVQDQSGNANAANVIVTVLDSIKPLVVTQNISVNLNSAGSASITAAQINNGSSDNCSISSLVLSKSTFSCADLGANNITLTVTDANGNVAVGNAIVTVVDVTSPVARPRNLTVYLNASGAATITAVMADSASTDNCGIASRAINTNLFTCANRGSNTVILTVTDAANNSHSANFTVTVLDTIRPIVAAQNITAYIGTTGSVSITAAQVTASSSDNCGIASAVISKS